MRLILKNFVLTFLFFNFSGTGLIAEELSDKKISQSKLNIVVIDPGHGGKDPGTSVPGAKEKDIVLDIALKLGKYIELRFPEVKVIYTRKTDVFIPLNKRAKIANSNNADLFLSIHANYIKEKYFAGTETFILGHHRSNDNLEIAKKENSVILLEDNYNATYEGFNPNSPESYIMFELMQNEYQDQSLQIASLIQNQFKNRAKRIDRGVKQAGFLVLRETTMPGVLIETGFISNDAEKNFLMSDSGRSYLASAIYRAFREYKEIIESKSSFNLNLTENTEYDIIKEDSELTTETDHKIWFSVQIATSRKLLELTQANFKGEGNIFYIKKGRRYKYYSGKYSTYDQALSEKNRLLAKFSDAFISAYENNKSVHIKDAILKTSK